MSEKIPGHEWFLNQCKIALKYRDENMDETQYLLKLMKALHLLTSYLETAKIPGKVKVEFKKKLIAIKKKWDESRKDKVYTESLFSEELIENI